LRGVPGVSQASVSSLALGGTSLLAVSYGGDPAALKIALAARGWLLEGEGTTFRMRRGRVPTPTPPAPTAPPPPDVPQQ